MSVAGIHRLNPEWQPQWQSWWCWYPRRVNGRWYWLDHIYRKETVGGQYIYGDEFDVLRYVDEPNDETLIKGMARYDHTTGIMQLYDGKQWVEVKV